MSRLRLRGCLMVLVLLTLLAGCSEKNELPTSTMVTSIEATSRAFSPTPIPTNTPIPTPTPIPSVTATILSAGDVIMHDAVIQSGKINEDQYDYRNIFTKIKPYADAADFSIISYEGVVMDSDKNYTGYPLFNAPPAIMSAFSFAGFDMVNTGNNHCLDRKLNGLLESRNIIKQENMQVIGTFQDGAEPRYKIQDLNGIKVGFLSYTYGCNMNENLLTEEEQNAHLSLIDYEKIQTEIEALSPRVDLVVALLHWGVEYRHEATKDQKELADNMFQWGADIILGSHPHVVEPSEIREIDGETKYLIYGMGNFLSNQIGGGKPNAKNNDFTEDGMLINLTIEKDMTTGKTSLISVEHIPTWVYRYRENDNYQYTIHPIPSLDDTVFDGIDDNLAEKLRNSYHRTMEKVQDYPSTQD